MAHIEKVTKTKTKTGKNTRPAKKAKRAVPTDDVTDTDSEHSLSAISLTQDRMGRMQEQYLTNEKTAEEIEYLKSHHANDSDVSSMNN